jgi:hypothetical protein
MANQSGTITSTEGWRSIHSTPNDSITFTVVSGTFSVEYPVGTLAISGATSTQTLTLTNGDQMRVAVTAGSLTYALTDGADGGAAYIATSRSALASDSGATLGLPSGSTYTIADASLIAAGVILQGTSSGGGTIAVGGSVTINGGTASISLTARQVAVLLPTPGSTTDLTCKVAY